MNNISRYTRFAIGLTALMFGIWAPGHAQQQSIPTNNIPQPPPGVSPLPIPYPDMGTLTASGSRYNYVRTQIPDYPVQTWPTATGTYRQSTDYFDGLGRSLQSVSRKSHADGYDIIQAYVYDSVGRETHRYLPFAAPLSNSDGNMELPVGTRQHGFYDALGPDEQPYSKTETDNSPLGRVSKSMAPGRSWVGGNRGVTYTYRSNLAVEDVRIFTIGATNTSLPATTAAYPVNSLSVTKTTDEDGKYSLEYKDNSGLVILRKVYESGTGQAHAGFACTYYVYDDLRRLRYVITPQAVVAATSSWNLSLAVNLCFSYFYDTRGRVVEQRIPGKEVEYLVYDNRDRLIFNQDGKLRAAAKWKFTAYDGLDRPYMSGLYTPTTNTAAYLNGIFSNTNNYVGSASLFYYLKKYNIYKEYPATNPTGTEVRSYTYYDDYTALTGFGFDATPFNGVTLPADGTVVPSVLSNHTRGLATSSKVLVLDPDNPTPTWLTTAVYYDAKGRVIQTQSQNIRGGVDTSSNIYYFQGMLWKNIIRHQNPSALVIPGATDGAIKSHTVVRTFERNLGLGGGNDQVYKATQKINDGIDYELAYYAYDHLGRVVVKQFTAANVLQEYNIRGFLDHIQVTNTNNDPTVNQYDPHIFEEDLYYDKGFASKLYNGNIAGITWKKAGSASPVEAYGYSYDNLDRLSHAEYRRHQNVTDPWINTAYDYTASNITYDLNGNIKTMNQRVRLPQSTGPITMDQLTYTYAAGNNRLVKVTDAIAATVTTPLGLPDFKDNANLAQEYFYDPNGNMVADSNKKVASITYTYDNKPEKITVKNQGTITYVYDASGNRLQKKVLTTATNTTVVYDYIGNFVYKDKVLQYILNEEGRARPIPVAVQGQPGSFDTRIVYDYFIKDHLGNVRSTVTAKPMDDIYLARHEIASANIEQLVFDNIPNVRDAKPGSTDPDDNMAALLNAADPNKRVGTAIMLRAMPGDRFNISVDAFYNGNYQQESSAPGSAIVSSLMNALLGGANYEGIPLSEMPQNAQLVTAALGNPALASQLDNIVNADNNPQAPKAHLNYLFFDQNMQLIPGLSGSKQVTANSQVFTGGWATITPPFVATGLNTCCVMTVPGYVIIYIDNQSIGKDVWFDNLMVGHYNGVVTEEDHYYPFGLTLNTSQAANALKNDFKFQTQRHENDFGLNMYNFKYRDHDPQIGRFWQVDPLAQSYLHNSTYAFSENKVTSHIELEGLEAVPFHMSNVWRSAGITSNSDPKEFVRQVGAETLKPESWVQAYAVTGQVAGVSLLALLTEGALTGTAIVGEASAIKNTMAEPVNFQTKIQRLQANAARGTSWEKVVTLDLGVEGETSITPQVTVKADNGTRTRIDIMSKSPNGNIRLTEAKSSATAPLTKNQKAAFPSIEQSGGVVVGKGKGDFPGGTRIPPTQVEIRRPPPIDNSLEGN